MWGVIWRRPQRLGTTGARFPGVFFFFGRELGGGHGEEQKGARRIVRCHTSPQSPVHNGKNGGRGDREKKGDDRGPG